MNQIVKSIVKEKGKEKKFLYYSYTANVLVICILVMIATGISNITNDSLSKNDLQQVKSIFSSVILVSALAILFFQWVISMQFKALFDSRKQFNNNIRLMGVSDRKLFNVYIRELLYMQPICVVVGAVFAEVLYYVLTGALNVEPRFIFLPQIILSILIHIFVVSLCVYLTYKKKVKINIINVIRNMDNQNSSFKFGIWKKIELFIGIIILIASIIICLLGKNEDERSWGYFGIVIAFFLVLDLFLIMMYRAMVAIGRKMKVRSILLPGFISLGYLKKNKVICNLIMFSTMLFLGLQMLFLNVRMCGADVVENNIHYKQTVWYQDSTTEKPVEDCYAGLKYKINKDNTILYISGVDSEFIDNYETIKFDNKKFEQADNLTQNLNSPTWDGIVMPNYYLGAKDIGKKVSFDINGKTVKFTIQGGYYNNNMAHITCLVSKSYLSEQLGLNNEANMFYSKSEEPIMKDNSSDVVTMSFDDLKQESYDKAVSGTSLVEMVSIVIIICAVLALINYIMISSKSSTVDIARLRGIGLEKSHIRGIYIMQSLLPVIVSVAVGILLSIMFAKISMIMVFDEAYYSRALVLTPSLMGLVLLVFGVVTLLIQLMVIKKVTDTDYYIKILRDVNE